MRDPTFFDGILIGLLIAMMYCDLGRLIKNWKKDKQGKDKP